MIERPIPPPPLRAAISDAVHEAVVERLAQIPRAPYDPRRFCWLYAAVGTQTAREFVGNGYDLEAGTLDFTSSAGASLLKDHGTPIAHHAWITLRDSDHLLEVVDLAARHYPFWFSEAGVPVPAWISPGIVWSRPADLPSGLVFTPEPSAAASIAKFQRTIGRIIDEAAAIALRRMRAAGFEPDQR